MADLSENEPSTPQDETAPPPRAFAQGTGLMLQTVGILLVLSNCCVCSLSFLWTEPKQPGAVMPDAPVAEEVEGGVRLGMFVERPAFAGVTLMVIAVTVGGLAMAGFGLGLQSDRRRAATGALVTCVVFTLLLIAAAVLLARGGGGWGVQITNGFLILLGISLVGFAFTAWRQVRADPPPRDIDILPEGFKIPYSMYHDDPPDVRMAKEIANRRAKLEAEQRELDQLEKELEQREDEIL